MMNQNKIPNPKTIKSQIKILAKDFDLKYKSDWFRFAWISKEQEVLAEFLSDCEDPIYEKYGKTLKERIKNLDKFVSSNDFQKCRKRFGGQACSRKGLESDKRILNKIENKFAKKEILQLHKIAERKIKSSDYIALLTKTKIKSEKEWIFRHILRHEWIHLLLYNNKIKFRNWRYNEGLNEYLAAFADKTLDNLESKRDKQKYPYEHQYFVYAIKFRDWLKDCKSPEEKIRKIKNILKKSR